MKSCCLFFSVLALLLLGQPANVQAQQNTATNDTAIEGLPSAHIKIVMFINPAGQDSADQWNTIRAPLAQQYLARGKIQIVYFMVPTDDYGMMASRFLQCVPSSVYVDLLSDLLTKQRLWRTGSQASYLQYLASKRGLVWEPVQNCMKDPNTKAKLEQNLALANDYYGVHSKPEYVILGTPYRFSRRASFTNIAAVIDTYAGK